jgi:hypothetical protein
MTRQDQKTVVARAHQAWPIALLLLAVALCGCAAENPQQLAEKQRLLASYPPPGLGRIWIFRTFQPEITQEQPYVRINGQIVGTALLGRAFYRDVPPGSYAVTVDSRGVAPNQFAHFGLAANQTAYVAIDANGWWAGLCWRCQIATFSTLVVAQQLALAELAALPIAGGG